MNVRPSLNKFLVLSFFFPIRRIYVDRYVGLRPGGAVAKMKSKEGQERPKVG